MSTKNIATLESHLGYWLRCLSNSVSGSFAARLERHDITVAQWVVLRTLYDRDTVSLNEAALLVGVDKSSLSRMMDRLLDKKLITRKTDKQDRRAQRLALTAAGRKIVPVLAREADENDSEFFKALTAPQRRELLSLVHIVLDAQGWTTATHGKDRLS
ncbi:MAG: MarR family transcriptional regulator [Alphaproteobacteria bacterium]|nr:MarR family transcriptional regulator [Alphaproteobacteria bacterium]MBU0859970.1 MarR family transcriptional regulator [Alphaproteobacteria bacterium]